MQRLALLLVLASVPLAAEWQQPAAPAPSAKIWVGRHADVEAFLRTAPFDRIEQVPLGVTRPLRGYFPPGGLVESAAWKVLPPGRAGGFWESYKSEIAAYELDKLLELGLVPPAVEKVWKGNRGAAVLWLHPVKAWKTVEALPKPDRWSRDAVRMKMFDNLIGNSDRNAGNLLVDDEWNLFLIDHSRAFVTDLKLPTPMTRIDKTLWDRMRMLDEPRLLAALKPWVERGAVRAILTRRDRMQVAIDKLLAASSETLVYVK